MNVTESLKELGRRIQYSRINLELRQEDLAAKAAVAVNTVARAEAGNPVKTDSLVRILMALGSEVGDLFSVLPEPTISPIALQALQKEQPMRVRKPKA